MGWSTQDTAGGGGVFGLGPAQNTFGDNATNDRAAAEALRDAYAAANAVWLNSYDANLSFWIRLQWDDGVIEQRRNVAGNGWQDVTNAIRGPRGLVGPVYAPADGSIRDVKLHLDTGKRHYIGSNVVYTQATAIISIDTLRGSVLRIGDSVYFLCPNTIDDSSVTLNVEVDGGGHIPLQDHDGDELSARELESGRIYELVRVATAFRTIGNFRQISESMYLRYAALSADQDFTEMEILAGTSSRTPTIIVPEYVDINDNFYVGFGVPDNTPDISGVVYNGLNQVVFYTRIAGVISVSGVDYKFWRSNSLLTDAFGGAAIVIQQQE